MVVLRIGELGDAVHEVDRGAEVGEAELALERIVHLAPAFGSRHARRMARAAGLAEPVYDRRVAAARPTLRSSRKLRAAPPELLCERVFRPLAHLVVLALLPLRVPPPAVVLASAATGLVAAAELAREQWIAAALLLQLKTVLDNADGQLARAAGKESVLGRYLDSESDLLVNAALFSALGYVTGEPWLALVSFLLLTLVL